MKNLNKEFYKLTEEQIEFIKNQIKLLQNMSLKEVKKQTIFQEKDGYWEKEKQIMKNILNSNLQDLKHEKTHKLVQVMEINMPNFIKIFDTSYNIECIASVSNIIKSDNLFIVKLSFKTSPIDRSYTFITVHKAEEFVTQIEDIIYPNGLAQVRVIGER